MYEEYYVDPRDVEITKDGEKRNLIYIYLESMENSYASYDVGGMQENNYIPNLSKLAEENVSFSNSEKLGGFSGTIGTGWTMGALMGTTSGIPYSFPINGNGMEYQDVFASGLYSMGDFLEDQGYRNLFLCGSDMAFAGRDKYFKQHGSYELVDYYQAEKEGYVPNDHFVWWGMEDFYLYEMAKDKLSALSADNVPFNLTLLTVDTHHTGGFVCEKCGNEYDVDLANVVSCADKQVADFVLWCQQQDFYDNTTIIITGDHIRMDNILVDNVEGYERTVYNCFVNAQASTSREKTCNRKMTPLDIFPTTLAALGYHIEGERLGLGTNLFSDKQTLAEEIGLDTLNSMMVQSSDYYVNYFAPEMVANARRFRYGQDALLDDVWLCGAEDYNLDQYESSGFSYNEGTMTAIDGKEATLKIPVSTEGKALVSIAMVWVYKPPQQYIVYCNDKKVASGTWDGNSTNYVEFVARPDNGLLNLRIEVPDAVSPAESGSSDTRELSIGISNIEVYKYSRFK